MTPIAEMSKYWCDFFKTTRRYALVQGMHAFGIVEESKQQMMITS